MATTVAVRERPILFSGEMVRAILDGRKTQTRRVILPQPLSMELEPMVRDHDEHPARFFLCDAQLSRRIWAARYNRRSAVGPGEWKWATSELRAACPFGQPGDRLWVRETWASAGGEDEQPYAVYRADMRGQLVGIARWVPSIHMPRWASRLTLEITEVRVERVQEITEADAKAEGTAPESCTSRPCSCAHLHGYRRLWDSLNGPRGYGWDANPWVWVLTFRRVEG